MIYVYRVISVYINIHVFDVFCVNSLLIIIGVRTCVYVSGDKKLGCAVDRSHPNIFWDL